MLPPPSTTPLRPSSSRQPGLKDIEHKVRIYNAETKFAGTRVNFDWYEIIPGTGKDAGGNPATSDAALAASLVIVAAAAAVVFTMKKR